MIKKMYILTFVFLLSTFSIACNTQNKNTEPAYLNPELPVNQRVNDLMQRMTLEEKVGQMCQYISIKHLKFSRERYKKTHKIAKSDDQFGIYPGISIDSLKQLTRSGLIGSFLHVKDVQEANELQKLALESRLNIPVLISIDAIHGHAFINGATVFPTQLALSSSWDDSLAYRIAVATAKEMRATGMQWTFSPNVELMRDARWGRAGETFGEDPVLVGRLGAAFTKGYQGDFGKDNVLACAKHYIGGGEPFNGLNAAPFDVSERTLRNLWFIPFKMQVDAGVFTFMAAHNEISGVPAHKSKFLLTGVLRNEWDFKGFVVSDWMDMERIYDLHHAAESYDKAFRQSVKAGMDMHMHGPGFYESVLTSVKEGKLDKKYIDRAARKILEAKFKIGLFEHPFADEKEAKKALNTPEHIALNLEAARKSIILLKNNGLLPFKGKQKIMLTGHNANNQRLLGDWTYKQPEENVITVYEGMKQVFSGAQVDYISSGESLRYPDNALLKTPIAKAANYDAVVIVVGSNSLRYEPAEKNCGENTDRAQINLQGNQLKLIQEIYKKNKNIVVVLINGRPLGIPWIKEHIPAIIEAWEPGNMGGQAVAEIIKGEINPSGKLTVTIPYDVGQIHTVYNYLPSSYLHHYVDMPSEPLWHFGYGMSYTTYEYSNLSVPENAVPKDTLTISVDVRNTGKMDGDEIVQLYIRDDYSQATRPVKELKNYKRIYLKKGESKTIRFKLPVKDLGYYNADLKYVIEPGSYTIMVGCSSRNKDLLKHKINIL